MRALLIVVSVAALVMLLVAPVAVYAGAMNLDTCKKLMFAATVVWFAASPFWMGKRAPEERVHEPGKAALSAETETDQEAVS